MLPSSQIVSKDGLKDGEPEDLNLARPMGSVSGAAVVRWAAILLPLGYLWFRLLNNLRVEWLTNPQYGYGLLVPVFCAGLFCRRWQERWDAANHSQGASLKRVLVPLLILAFLFLPARLVEAATPEWRTIQWMLGIEAVGLTLCFIHIVAGLGGLRSLAFPVCFFLVAIPWPTLIEAPIVQGLTHISAAIVAELLNWLSTPAAAHGSVIEVATGMVGIDEACSGIRSFQSTLMISLFFGEFYRLSTRRRLLLVPLGFALSLVFNIVRMSILTFVAAKKGVAAVAKYHDPAGITIAVLCTLTLWGVALILMRQQRKSADAEANCNEESFRLPEIALHRVSRAGVFLLVWFATVETSVQLWYRIREAGLETGPAWSVNLPLDNPTLKNQPIEASTQNLLRYDTGEQATWRESDETIWKLFYFSWQPGRVAGYLAKRHTPEICLAATGVKRLSGPELFMMNIHGVELPIRSYQFETSGEIIQVFHCRWEGGASRTTYVEHESARYNLLRSIWTGRGNKGQKVLELVVSGINDPETAKVALRKELDKLVELQGEAVRSL